MKRHERQQTDLSHVVALKANPNENKNKESITVKKITEPINILENVLPLTEKQRAEVELFKKLINS